MAWDYTTIRHRPRIQLNLDCNEYCVLDYIYQKQRAEGAPVAGWCIAALSTISRDLGIASRTLDRMIKKMQDLGFMQTSEKGRRKRVTGDFYSIVYNAEQRHNGVTNNAKVASNPKANNAKVAEELRQSGEQNNAKVANSNIVSNIKEVISSISEQSSPKENPVPFAKIIIQYLIEKTGKKYRIPENELDFRNSSKFKLINARFRQGYSPEDFVKVIDIKCLKWMEDEKMNEFLRPSTLFCASNFEKYLDEWENVGLVGSTPTASGGIAPDQEKAKQQIVEIFKAHKKEWNGNNSKYRNQAQTDYVEALRLFYIDYPEIKKKYNATTP